MHVNVVTFLYLVYYHPEIVNFLYVEMHNAEPVCVCIFVLVGEADS